MSNPNAEPGEFPRALLNQIAELRRLHPEITQDVIAAAIGKSQPHVSMRIHGRYPWSGEEIDIIARLFGMDPFEFIAAARQHVGSHPVTPLDPAEMTVSQLESLPNATATPRGKRNR